MRNEEFVIGGTVSTNESSIASPRMLSPAAAAGLHDFMLLNPQFSGLTPPEIRAAEEDTVLLLDQHIDAYDKLAS